MGCTERSGCLFSSVATRTLVLTTQRIGKIRNKFITTSQLVKTTIISAISAVRRAQSNPYIIRASSNVGQEHALRQTSRLRSCLMSVGLAMYVGTTAVSGDDVSQEVKACGSDPGFILGKVQVMEALSL